MSKKLPPQGTSQQVAPLAVIRDAVESIRCDLSTIAGIAESNGPNALNEVAWTAHAGLARLRLLLPEEPTPKETSEPCDYFKDKESAT